MVAPEIFYKSFEPLNCKFSSPVLHLLPRIYPIFTCLDKIWILIHNTVSIFLSWSTYSNLQTKGSVSRDFQPPFFHDSKPSRLLINRLKYFRVRFRFHRDIRIFKKLRAPRSQTAHRGVRIENFAVLWLLLKEQPGEIFLGVNTSIMKEKVWSIKFVFAKPKIMTPRCRFL